jgi:hypothetical protein
MWLIVSILVALASLFGGHNPSPMSRDLAHLQRVAHPSLSVHTDSGSGPVGSAQP